MPELGMHFEYTLELLAGRIVTPERYGAPVVAEEVTLVTTDDDPWPSLFN